MLLIVSLMIFGLYVLAEDTFKFNIDTLSLYKAYVDDTLWGAYSALKKRFSLDLKIKENMIVNDKKNIRDILNESILIGERKDEVNLLIPSEAQISLQKMVIGWNSDLNWDSQKIVRFYRGILI